MMMMVSIMMIIIRTWSLIFSGIFLLLDRLGIPLYLDDDHNGEDRDRDDDLDGEDQDDYRQKIISIFLWQLLMALAALTSPF